VQEQSGPKVAAAVPISVCWVPIVHNVAWTEAYLRTKWHLDPANRLATIHQRYRQTGQIDKRDRQRPDSIGQTVLQTIAQKHVRRQCAIRFESVQQTY